MWKIYKKRTPELATNTPGGGLPQQADNEGEEIYSNSTLSEESDEATKLSKLPRLTLI